MLAGGSFHVKGEAETKFSVHVSGLCFRFTTKSINIYL